MAEASTSKLQSMADESTVERSLAKNLGDMRHEVEIWAEAMQEAALNVVTLLDMASEAMPRDTDADKARALVAASAVLVHDLIEDHGRLAGCCEALLQQLGAKELAHG